MRSIIKSSVLCEKENQKSFIQSKFHLKAKPVTCPEKDNELKLIIWSTSLALPFTPLPIQQRPSNPAMVNILQYLQYFPKSMYLLKPSPSSIPWLQHASFPTELVWYIWLYCTFLTTVECFTLWLGKTADVAVLVKSKNDGPVMPWEHVQFTFWVTFFM